MTLTMETGNSGICGEVVWAGVYDYEIVIHTCIFVLLLQFIEVSLKHT